jgi:CheY-like chemotaxis protein
MSATRGKDAAVVRPKILIVDDERDLVDTCVRLLAPRGYTCSRAYTGTQAIALIDAEPFDLVLTDLHLPVLGGLSVLAHARGKTPPIPGVLMTAYGSPRTAGHAYDAGALSYVAKPFSAAELIGAIDRALG